MSVVDTIPWHTALSMAREGKDEELFNLLRGDMHQRLDVVRKKVQIVRDCMVTRLHDSLKTPKPEPITLHACGSYMNGTALDGDGDLDIDIILTNDTWRQLELPSRSNLSRGSRESSEYALQFLYDSCKDLFKTESFILRNVDLVTRSFKFVFDPDNINIEVDMFVKHFDAKSTNICSFGHTRLAQSPQFQGNPRDDRIPRESPPFSRKCTGVLLLKLFKKQYLDLLKSCLIWDAAKDEATAIIVARACVRRLIDAIGKPVGISPLVVRNVDVMMTSEYTAADFETLQTDLGKLEHDLAVTHHDVQVAAYVLRSGQEASLSNAAAWLQAEDNLLKF